MKNIIFDIGSVLLGYRWMEMCLDAGWDKGKAEKVGLGFFDNSKWSDFDAGFVTVDELVADIVKKHPELEEDARWFILSGKQMTVGRPRVWEMMGKLKEKGFGIYLLSNYSETLFTLHTEGLPFWEFVDGAVISYQIHQIKPNPQIYQYLLQTYHLEAKDCIFFDDRPDNTEGARALGIEAVTVVDGSEEFLLGELQKLLLE